jgi:hypothetical protein
MVETVMEVDEEARAEEQELIRESEYPHPLPEPNDRIFKPATNLDHQWVERTFPRESIFTDAYKYAGDLLCDQLETMSRDLTETGAIDITPWLVYPIYFNYRHAIELSLKQIWLGPGALAYARCQSRRRTIGFGKGESRS